jgi:hypothetical protein
MLSIAGFVPGMIDTSRRNGSTTPIVVIHGLAMAAWLVLYLTQTLLAATGRLNRHRRLGVAGGVFALVVVVSGVVTTLEAAGRGSYLSGDLVRFNAGFDFVGFMILPFGDVLVFGAFVAAAVLYRRKPDAHKRLMLFAIIGGLIAAPIVHIVGHFPVPPAAPPLLLLAMFCSSAIHDKLSRRKVHPVSWFAPIVIIAFVVARNMLLANSTVWHDFVAWWVGL